MNFYFLIIVSVLYFAFPFHSGYTSLFHSADHFYLPSLILDIQENSADIFDWNLQPAPGFFPEFLVFYAFFKFLPLHPNFYFAVYSLLSIHAIIFLSLGIVKRSYLSEYEYRNIRNWLFFFLSLSASIVALDPPSSFLPYLGMATHHSGALIMSFISIHIVIGMKTGRKLPLKVFFLLAVLLFFWWNDGYFLALFILPFVIVYFLTEKSVSKKIGILVFLAILILIRKESNQYMEMFFSVPRYQPGKIIFQGILDGGFEVFHVYQSLFLYLSRLKAFDASLLILSLFSFLPLLQYAFPRFRDEEAQSYRNHCLSDPILFLKLYFPLAIFISLSSILLIQKFLASDLLFADRYYSPVVYFGLFQFTLLFRRVGFPRFPGVVLIAGFPVLIFFMIISKHIIDYREPLVDCLEEEFSKPSLRKRKDSTILGLGDYWDSKPVEHHSKKQFRVYPIRGKKPDTWIGKKTFPRIEIDFLVSKPNSAMDVSFFLNQGEPHLIEKDCGRKIIYIYGEKKKVRMDQ